MALKSKFQLYDEKGAATEKGTIEEWWKTPSVHKTVFTSPSYTSTEISTKDGSYRGKGAPSPPFLLEQVLKQVVHPMPDERDLIDSKPEIQKQTLGKVPLDCIILSQGIKQLRYATLGLFPTYCFDRDMDSLRLVYDFGSQLTVRNQFGSFQERKVAIDPKISVNSIDAVSGLVEGLQTMPLAEDEFAPPSDFEKIDADAITVSSDIMKGLVLRRPKPAYPVNARRNHISGAVVIAVRIGRDGRVRSMKLASAPDRDLAIAALAAVRQWVYRPYLLNGEPTEVQTTVTVNFSFGPA